MSGYAVSAQGRKATVVRPALLLSYSLGTRTRTAPVRARSVLDLANKAYFLNVPAAVRPDLLEEAKNEEWSALADDFRTFLVSGPVFSERYSHSL